jgi:hypothetical protein
MLFQQEEWDLLSLEPRQSPFQLVLLERKKIGNPTYIQPNIGLRHLQLQMPNSNVNIYYCLNFYTPLTVLAVGKF